MKNFRKMDILKNFRITRDRDAEAETATVQFVDAKLFICHNSEAIVVALKDMGLPKLKTDKQSSIIAKTLDLAGRLPDFSLCQSEQELIGKIKKLYKSLHKSREVEEMGLNTNNQ